MQVEGPRVEGAGLRTSTQPCANQFAHTSINLFFTIPFQSIKLTGLWVRVSYLDTAVLVDGHQVSELRHHQVEPASKKVV